MAAKKKSKKKLSGSNRTVAQKTKPAKKSPKKKVSSKKKSPKKAPRKIVIKKTAVKKTSIKSRPIANKAVARKPIKASSKRQFRDNDQLIEAPPIQRQRSTGNSSGQSGDLQGLSNSERADSESVDELIEEGNAFEAGIVSGVEDADNADEKEVHTREVPEDDVPGEYLDEQ
jgi:hypothetical protein